jgi:hypothetical protein
MNNCLPSFKEVEDVFCNELHQGMHGQITGEDDIAQGS